MARPGGFLLGSCRLGASSGCDGVLGALRMLCTSCPWLSTLLPCSSSAARAEHIKYHQP